MKWGVVAAGFVVMANAIAVAPSLRERAGDVQPVTVRVCRSMLFGGNGTDAPLGLALELTSRPVADRIPGLDPAGLRSLGFSERQIRMSQMPVEGAPRGIAARPAWIRLRQDSASGGRFIPVEVAAKSEALPRDSTSLVVRGLVALSPGAREQDLWRVEPRVRELLPPSVHLDRHQAAALMPVQKERRACEAGMHAVLANGAAGGLWVRAVAP